MKKLYFGIALLIAIYGCSGSGSAVKTYYEEKIDSKGHLFIIGGGDRPDYMMEKLMSLVNGTEKSVLIIPFASSEPEMTGNYQREQFLKLGAASCDVLLSHKDSVDSPEILEQLNGVNIVFFSGGDQNVLVSYLAGTMLLDKIKEIYKEGGVVGGTSAGAAVMSKIMITGKEKHETAPEDSFVMIAKDNILTSEGFGFLENVIVDQHFLIRKRHNRLFSVLMDNPGMRGVGIDEATAIIVKPDNSFEVIGESSVLVYEPQNHPSYGDSIPAFIIRIISSGETYSF